jgi:hypothetical protein
MQSADLDDAVFHGGRHRLMHAVGFAAWPLLARSPAHDGLRLADHEPGRIKDAP